jgi:hydroxyacylglutathione hydrolase
MEASARLLFASLRRLEADPDHLLIWPGHGSGSACGKSLGGVPVSSLGYERLTNWGLRTADESTFVEAVLAGQPDPPMYFGDMKRVNKIGLPAWHPTPELPPASVGTIVGRVSTGHRFVDVRPGSGLAMLPGSIAIPLGRSFSGWAGSVLPASPFSIVAADAASAASARRELALIGRTDALEWVSPDALGSYRARGGRLETIASTGRVRAEDTLVDVRTTTEWQEGHLEGALHVPLARLPDRAAALDRSASLVVYCQSGVRAIVAASALRQLGFTRVAMLAGGLNRLQEGTRTATAVA